MLWDCKVTPVYGASQERNTICCISSNDGLDAGLADGFSTSRMGGDFKGAEKSLSDWGWEGNGKGSEGG